MLTITFLTYVVTMSDLPFVKALRDEIIYRFGDNSWLAYLVTCAWCSGFWISGIVTGTVYVLDVVRDVPVLIWLAAPAVSGILLELVMVFWSLKILVGKSIMEDR